MIMLVRPSMTDDNTRMHARTHARTHKHLEDEMAKRRLKMTGSVSLACVKMVQRACVQVQPACVKMVQPACVQM